MGADSFMWGSATAAYQCEGAWQDGEKIPSNWDAFCHNKVNDAVTANGDVASDHYHRFEEDLDMMKAGNQNAYRFSIAWTRIMREDGTPNPEGIAHYSNVINACLNRGIEPLVTLYHYDMPDYLLQRGGWEIREIAKSFVTYVNTCFEAFGDRDVSHAAGKCSGGQAVPQHARARRDPRRRVYRSGKRLVSHRDTERWPRL